MMPKHGLRSKRLFLKPTPGLWWISQTEEREERSCLAYQRRL
jgi:hypothetical protein